MSEKKQAEYANSYVPSIIFEESVDYVDSENESKQNRLHREKAERNSNILK